MGRILTSHKVKPKTAQRQEKKNYMDIENNAKLVIFKKDKTWTLKYITNTKTNEHFILLKTDNLQEAIIRAREHLEVYDIPNGLEIL